MLNITHYSNSFIVVKSEGSSIVCDPWIGKTSDNGWYSYPLINEKSVDKKDFNSEFIYLSHIHCDHIDPKTLKKFNNNDLTFIIKKFRNGVLKRRLQRLFPKKKIIEIEPFKKRD